jgi:hypothetical protein
MRSARDCQSSTPQHWKHNTLSLSLSQRASVATALLLRGVDYGSTECACQ